MYEHVFSEAGILCKGSPTTICFAQKRLLSWKRPPTTHTHTYIHMVELHNTKDLKVVKLVIERDLNTLEVETAAFILLLFFGAAPSHFDGNGYKKKNKKCYRISSN